MAEIQNQETRILAGLESCCSCSIRQIHKELYPDKAKFFNIVALATDIIVRSNRIEFVFNDYTGDIKAVLWKKPLLREYFLRLDIYIK